MWRIAVLAAAGMLASGSALAQSDIVGEYVAQYHEDGPDPDIGDFGGLPINAASRAQGQAWSSSLWTVPEHQCVPHPSDYVNFGSLRVSKDVDPVTQTVVAYHTNLSWMNPNRTIWMDGRAHPPADALHTWEGFSTGVWQGDMLTVTTTHLKPAYIRRNGLPRSPDAVLTEHFIRVGDYLTLISIIDDPVYLTEPFIKSRSYRLDPGYQMALYPCSVDVEVPRPEGSIPHFLPGQNGDLYEFAMKHNLPPEAVGGGAETAYPDYQARMEGGYRPPQRKGPPR
jgi:hypothetical protein